jgi:hypothetical protein
MVPIHVNDGIIVGDDTLDQVLAELNTWLHDHIKEVPLGLFLGINIHRVGGEILINQSHYIIRILNKYGYMNASTSTMPCNLNAVPPPWKEGDGPTQPDGYRELLGLLLYLMLGMRPDLAYALTVARQYVERPLPCTGFYLPSVGTYTARLPSGYSTKRDQTRQRKALLQHGVIQVDQATQRSMTGYVFTLGGDPDDSTAFTWSSKWQATVSILNTEAEYVALSVVTQEAAWRHQLLVSLGYPKLDLH